MDNPPIQTEATPGRAAGRLSLKVMVLSLLVILLGVGGTAVYIWVWPIYAQERFLRELEAQGVKFDRDADDLSPASGWVRKSLGFEPPPSKYRGPLVAIGRDRKSEVEVLRHLKDVILEISKGAYTEDPIWWLSKCLNITKLEIGEGVIDDDLMALKDLKQLKTLTISNGGLKGTFFVHLPVNKLTDVTFYNVHATSQWAEHMAALSKVKILYFESSRLDAGAIHAILQLPAIVDLWIHDSETQWPEVSEKIASPIKTIHLKYSKVDRSAMKAWARLPELVELELDHSTLDTSALAHLIDTPKLKSLYLEHTKLDDRAVEHLVKMATLRELSLRGTAITDEGFEALLRKTKVTILDVSKTKVTVKGLEALLREHSLKSLSIASGVQETLSESLYQRIIEVKPDLTITGTEDPKEEEPEPAQPPTPSP